MFVYLHREIIIHAPNIRIFPQTSKQNEQKRENNHSTRTAGQVGRGLRMHPGHGCKRSELQPRLRPGEEDPPRRPHPVRWPAGRVVNITHAVEGCAPHTRTDSDLVSSWLSENLVPSTAFLLIRYYGYHNVSSFIEFPPTAARQEEVSKRFHWISFEGTLIQVLKVTHEPVSPGRKRRAFLTVNAAAILGCTK